MEGSPAQKAGIHTGDVITSVNGQPVKSNGELRNAIGLMRVGDKVEIGLTDANSSCLIHAPGVAHTRYVVMPMRL